MSELVRKQIVCGNITHNILIEISLLKLLKGVKLLSRVTYLFFKKILDNVAHFSISHNTFYVLLVMIEPIFCEMGLIKDITLIVTKFRLSPIMHAYLRMQR